MDPAMAIPNPAAVTADVSEFTALVRQHQAMVFSLAYHFVGNRAIAEELAQDVMLELYRHYREFESAEHMVNWLRRVTANRCIDRARKSKRQPEVPLDAVFEPAAPAAEADPLLSTHLRRLVASLPEKARMVVLLRYQEDLDPEEIAAVLRIPVNTVKSQLHRALGMLRKKAGAIEEEK